MSRLLFITWYNKQTIQNEIGNNVFIRFAFEMILKFVSLILMTFVIY